MFLRALVLAAVAALAACGGGHSESSPAPATPVQAAANAAVSGGLAGVAFQHLTLTGTTQGLAGLRELGTRAAIQPGDAFMIGSTTKAMTAALAGRLVEQGAIAWDTTLAEALPDLAAGMQPAYRTVTLAQLLDHRGGVLSFQGGGDLDRFQAYLQTTLAPLPTTLPGRERFFAAWLLAQDPPAGAIPGQTFAYSNAGYALAVLMLETRTGRPYTELMQQELAQPLGMNLSWTPADASFINRPVGHAGAKGRLATLAPAAHDDADWLDVLRPGGGGTTLTPDSYATWVRWHLRALQGQATPLPRSYIARLQALPAGDYALGWMAAAIDGRPVLVHDGEYRGFGSLLAVDLQGRSASFGFTNTEADDATWVIAVLNQSLLDIERALPPTP